MARKTRTRKVAAKPSGEDLGSLLETIRSLWNATEQANAAVREWSQKAIVDAILRLNRQVASKLRLAAAIPPAQPRLFCEEGEFEQVPCAEAEPAYPEPSRPRFPEPKLRTYAKALAKQALEFIPHSGGFSDLDAYREHLAVTLPFNSRATQRQLLDQSLLSRRMLQLGFAAIRRGDERDAHPGRPGRKAEYNRRNPLNPNRRTTRRIWHEHSRRL